MAQELEVLDCRWGQKTFICPRPALEPMASLHLGGRGAELIFQELKRRDLKPNHSSLSNAEVKNEWHCAAIVSVGCLSSGPTPLLSKGYYQCDRLCSSHHRRLTSPSRGYDTTPTERRGRRVKLAFIGQARKKIGLHIILMWFVIKQQESFIFTNIRNKCFSLD